MKENDFGKICPNCAAWANRKRVSFGDDDLAPEPIWIYECNDCGWSSLDAERTIYGILTIAGLLLAWFLLS